MRICFVFIYSIFKLLVGCCFIPQGCLYNYAPFAVSEKGVCSYKECSHRWLVRILPDEEHALLFKTGFNRCVVLNYWATLHGWLCNDLVCHIRILFLEWLCTQQTWESQGCWSGDAKPCPFLKHKIWQMCRYKWLEIMCWPTVLCVRLLSDWYGQLSTLSDHMEVGHVIGLIIMGIEWVIKISH